MLPGAPRQFAWSGKQADGAAAPSGVYTLTARAIAADGTTAAIAVSGDHRANAVAFGANGAMVETAIGAAPMASIMRIAVATVADATIASTYVPNGGKDLPAKMKFLADLTEWAADRTSRGQPVVICGDLNVAHTELDLANPKPNRGKKGFTDEEREGFQNFLDAGFVDTFRIFTQGNGHYSWWSHFANARARNVGWRIDYVLVSESLRGKVKEAKIHADVMGSDHCPVSIRIDL